MHSLCGFIMRLCGAVQCRRPGDSQGRSDPDQQQHPERDAFVEVPVLHGHGHHQSPHKQHVSVLQVLHTHLNNTVYRTINVNTSVLFWQLHFLKSILSQE